MKNLISITSAAILVAVSTLSLAATAPLNPMSFGTLKGNTLTVGHAGQLSTFKGHYINLKQGGKIDPHRLKVLGVPFCQGSNASLKLHDGKTGKIFTTNVRLVGFTCHGKM